MNDYLNNLIAKNFKMAEVIKPRPISIFEPFPEENWPRHEHPCMQDTLDSEQIPPEKASVTFLSKTLRTVTPLSESGQEVIPNLRNYQWTDTSSREDVSPEKQEDQGIPPDPVSVNTSEKNLLPSFIRTKNQKQSHTDRFFLKQNQSKSGSLFPESASGTSQSISCRKIRKSVQTMEYKESEPANIYQGRLSEYKSGPKVFNQTMLKGAVAEADPPVGTGDGIIVKRDTMVPACHSHKASKQETQSQPEITPNIRYEPPASQAKPKTLILQPDITPLHEYTMPMIPVIKEQKPQKESSPAIYVTIGCIEVRAMPQPTPPAKKKKPGPVVMSLDEYLRQRTKGGNE